jgi:two-component sensor histidine kinase
VDRKVVARVESQRWYLRFPRAVPVGIFLLVSAITALSLFAIERLETQRAEAQHRQMANTVSAALERLANANGSYLRAGAALFTTREHISADAFHEFTAQLSTDESFRGAVAMGWGTRIERSQVPAFERAMRAMGSKGYTVKRIGSGGWAVPVTFIDPDTAAADRLVMGFDMYGEPTRRQAMDRAALSGRPTATSRVVLMQSESIKNAKPGFLIYMPVYEGVGINRRVKGFVYRAFNAQDFLVAALNLDRLEGYGVRMFDGEPKTRKDFLGQVGNNGIRGRLIEREIYIADHRMVLEIAPPNGSKLSSLSLLTLLFGMLVAALLLVVARLVTQQALEDRAALAWFEEQASIRNSLTRELNHRVKNTLANVLSIVALTRRRTDNLDDFVHGLNGRIRALSATHDLLTQSEWGTTPVRSVIEAELMPYAQDTGQTVTMRGPNVELAPNDALSLGLAIHELATNASKYGALTAMAGRIVITWEMITDRLARIEWRELDGPPVPSERRRGFGTDLIEKIVAHELRNPVDLQFAPEGVRCTLVIPIRAPANFQIRAPRQ